MAILEAVCVNANDFFGKTNLLEEGDVLAHNIWDFYGQY